ncbi:sigma-70 family RNA polymerase sigma factor [Paludisphaera rhizosphaerae]|uniref:sigma-70 family RNA polymerase sigma factor n=1 Tax=Paludisphaera rhizosphaerae TaxID=2711216 RepID=UPI001980B229|nr:sigma-70 family RNA polymerase sigma factor [Paludisphaera rhizosphaerae]
MGKGRDGGLSHVRVLFNEGAVAGLTDAQLLERFTTREGESAQAAFATIVDRHGPMVLRVCGSVLRDRHEAEDAFQATFLVLARRAGSLWVRGSLGPWLHQTAYRASLNARAAAARRRRHEQRAAELAPSAVHEDERDDQGEVIHEEVDRLPEGCRSAVVLCYFEGLSPEQAARVLECPVGTVQSRLARGRERLRSRLSRRGLGEAVGALMGASPLPAPSALLADATVKAASSLSGAAASAVAVRIAEGVLRTMFLTKIRTAALALVATAALAVAGAQTLRQGAAAPAPPVDLNAVRAALGATPDALNAAAESSSPPVDLVWKDLPPAEALGVIESLSALTRANYEKIKTWKGSYSSVVRQYLSVGFVTDAAGSNGPFNQQFDSVLKFAVDVNRDALYRDVETSRMRFLKIGSNEEVKVPNVAADDHRSVTTPESYLVFSPKTRATWGVMQNVPEAKNARKVDRFPTNATESRHDGPGTDPREFFKTDPMNWFWSGLDRYARAMKGESGARAKKVVEEQLKVSKADGPGGVWYQERMWYDDGRGGPRLKATTIWSPQAGYNPVARIMAFDAPDGKEQGRKEWRWRSIDGVLIPSWVKDTNRREPGGEVSLEHESKLLECVLNQPLDAHQFDEFGLGVADGDIILNHKERVGYIVRDGAIVKLAGFGERSILKPNVPRPAPAASKAGRIYTTAILRTDDAGRPVSSVVAVDPDAEAVSGVFERAPNRFRLSPDGRFIAYVLLEPIDSNSGPNASSLWIREGGGEPRRVVRLDGASSGEVPVWSPDGKRLIVSKGTLDEARKAWIHETILLHADGSGQETLKIPREDTVQDWSPDGSRILTASSRNAKIGWQLYVMNLDGSNPRQITEGGNPFSARFSPDGRRILYTDGPKADRRGIWVVDLDGSNRRRVFDEDGSACWSPDGKRIAVAVRGRKPEEHARLEVVDLETGSRRTVLTMPGQEIADMPDWR